MIFHNNIINNQVKYILYGDHPHKFNSRKNYKQHITLLDNVLPFIVDTHSWITNILVQWFTFETLFGSRGR
jgi:hypothetical protein